MVTAAVEAATPARRRLTVEEFERLIEMDFFGKDERLEFVDGEVVVMPPIGDVHASPVGRFTALLFDIVRGEAFVWVQNPIRQLDERPQPDLALVRREANLYSSGASGPDDLLLVVKVGDSCLAYDRGTKLDMYARADLPEVWIFDVGANRLEVHRELKEGKYRLRLLVQPGEPVAPLAFPDRPIYL